MPTTTYTYTVSGNYTLNSTMSGLSFTMTGTAVPSGATIQSANFSASRVNHYSLMRQFKVQSGGVDLFPYRTGSASDGSQIALNIPITGIIPYNTGAIPVTFVGSRGTASVDGDIISIRDGCLIQIVVTYEEYTPPVGSPPEAPIIRTPYTGGLTYNATPRVLVTLGSDPGNLNQTISMAGYAPSRTGALSPGSNLVMRRSSALTASGSQNISAVATNTGGYSSTAASRSFTFTAPSFMHSQLIAGTTPVYAVDMVELRIMVDNLCAYYGITAPEWTPITAQQTSLGLWTEHVLAIRAAIDAIVEKVNSWDVNATTNKITAVSWLAIPENRPRVDVMEQLRNTIPLL